MSEPEVEHLIAEYSEPFSSFDDATLARWLSQTLSQLRGKYWRMSHPFINTYRFAAKVAHQRQIWLKRLANPPPEFQPSNCCRAPLFVIFSRDILKSGLICVHCGETALEFEEFEDRYKQISAPWLEQYDKLHQIAHWEEEEQKKVADYEAEYSKARNEAMKMLIQLEEDILPEFLDILPAFAWEDQDECLEIAPEDFKNEKGGEIK